MKHTYVATMHSNMIPFTECCRDHPGCSVSQHCILLCGCHSRYENVMIILSVCHLFEMLSNFWQWGLMSTRTSSTSFCANISFPFSYTYACMHMRIYILIPWLLCYLVAVFKNNYAILFPMKWYDSISKEVPRTHKSVETWVIGTG